MKYTWKNICRERFRSLLRYGSKHDGYWNDVCIHGTDGNCFIPDHDDMNQLINDAILGQKIREGKDNV